MVKVEDAIDGEAIELVQEGLMTVAEAGRFAGLSRSSLYALMEEGKLVYAKIGRARRIPRRALVELAASSLRGGWSR
jgi:excisionase family DNA binding protein